MSDSDRRQHAETRQGSPSEADLASDKMGNNQLEGNDQEDVRNQRHAAADPKQEADDVMESFEKADKDVRARQDLGKGNRHAPEHAYNRDADRPEEDKTS